MGTPLNVLTIATGKKLYVDMAVNLARSFWLWNSNTGIKFNFATDQSNNIPEDVKAFVNVINITPGGFGEGFSPKLHLDKLAPPGQTLFIDSDCLVYGNLLPVFKKFEDHAVSVVGGYVSQGEWFGDIGTICKKFDVTQLPKFNGGIYYLENGEIAVRTYETARNLEKHYDEIGFTRLRGRPNDEVLMALSMELNNQQPIEDDGSVLAEFVNFQSGIKSDLLKGFAELYNNPASSAYQEKWHLTVARPLIVHYLGHHNQLMPYTKEVRQLQYIFENKFAEPFAKWLTYFQIALPSLATSYFKNTFRSLYHSVFGTRKIKKSERIID